MDQNLFQELLEDLNLGNVAYFSSTTSTNDVAADWVKEGAPDFSVVAADTQTRGRGRSGRTWYTKPNSALAISIILKPQIERTHFSRYTALGAIGVCRAIQDNINSPALIKWPNDVLIENKKVAGVLTEVIWSGNSPQAIIIGIGVNITKESLPLGEKLNYPASYLAAYTTSPPDRFQVLYGILSAIKSLRNQIDSELFIHEWENLLAFRDQNIEVLLNLPQSKKTGSPFSKITGLLKGIDQNGMLLVKLVNGKIKSFAANEIKILPKD